MTACSNHYRQNLRNLNKESVMSILITVLRTTPESLVVFWMLARIMIPIMIATELLLRIGVIEAVSPIFAPVMNLVGLPSALGLAWLTAMIIGIWGAVPLLFTLVPVSSLSVADVTVFSALILFAHGLPVEQKIIEQVGPSFFATTTLRIFGGLIYAYLLHHILSTTNWLSESVNPTWIPMSEAQDWFDFFFGLGDTMLWMLIILVVLSWSLEILKLTGVLTLIMKAISPVLRLAGIQREAGHLTMVGLILGVSYGAGLLLQETRSNTISPRQIFLSCVFIGFSHSVIEDTLLVMALGADGYGVLLGRLIFTIAATAAIAALLRYLPERTFFKYIFREQRTL